jgi:hypothetical protein
MIKVVENPRSRRNFRDHLLSLLSSLGCMVSGLQQQLAVLLQYLLNVKGTFDSLMIWLWAKYFGWKPNCSSSL